MDMEGSLELVSLPSLVQLIIQEGLQALIRVEAHDHVGMLYLDAGQLCHAELHGPGENVLAGEEAVYKVLNWQTGRFRVQNGVLAPQVTIEHHWDFLLMEGLRRLDERRAGYMDDAVEVSPEDILSNLLEADAAVLQEMAAQQKETLKMANLNQTLEAVMGIDGAVAAALVDWESGLTLGTIGNGLDIELAAAGNTNVVRAKMSIMKELKLKGGIEDILITLTEQYHLIRMLDNNPNLFLYVALRRDSSNLGLARHRLAGLEKDLLV